ncbi:MAG: SusC/RagA family TonB-linked outer membrane protein [Chitinophagaceae bacterium]|nr:MAG: SusC/RagA family TonB-linked outer membrane protein [Chitinophagaceae bacterium]
MMKHIQYILKLIFILILLTSIAYNLQAQQKDLNITLDSTALHATINDPVEQGRLFDLPWIYSTAAVSTIQGRDLYKTPDANLANTLIGRLPGLYVKQSSGEPLGTPGMVNATSMNIHGIGSYGFSNPYYNNYKIYVDGFETDLNYLIGIPAADIQSISVLKDASALATFGMEGDNGIIWVVTKRGHAGKPSVQFAVRTGIQQPVVIDKPLDAYKYATLYNEAISNDNGNIWTPYYSDAQLQAYKNGTGTNIDWYDEALRNSAPYTDGNLTFSGGNSSAKYNVSLGYLNQQGLFNIANSDETSNELLNRYNVHTNLDFNLFKIFEATVDVGGRIENQKSPNYNTTTLWNNIAAYPANIYPVFADSGKWSGTAIYPNNPVASEKALGWISNTYRLLRANFGLKEKLDFITQGLYAHEAYSFYSYGTSQYSKTADYARYFDSVTTTTNKTTPIQAQSQHPEGQVDWKQATVMLGYEHLFGKSNITSAVNYYQSDYRGDGLVNYAVHSQNISGRFNYAYNNKYVGEFGFSYYGSDAFAPHHRWGFYPALSAAWIVSNENFLKNNHVLSFLKIRASIGKSGGIDDNAPQSGRYLYQQYYQNAALSGGAFYMGNSNPTYAPVLNPLYTANPDVFAEQSLKYDIGADLNLFKNLHFTADFFQDKRSGILTPVNSIPDYFGYNIIYQNIGKVTNKGFDLSSVYTNKAGQVGYSITGMASWSKNKINYMAETPPAYAYNAQTGRSIGTPIGLLATGYYQLNDFNADGSLKNGEAVPAFGAVQPGDLKYKDLNGDGKIDQTDVTAIGNAPYPQLYYSFGGDINFKGFDLSVFFDGTEGADVNILTQAGIQTSGFVNNGNVFSLQENAWAYYPGQGIDTRATATYPRLTTVANNNNYQASTFWIKSDDFLRLHNAELGYSFSQKLLKRAKITQLRVYINAVDLVTWSSLLKNYHLDPETLAGYPVMKSYNFGFVVTF